MSRPCWIAARHGRVVAEHDGRIEHDPEIAACPAMLDHGKQLVCQRQHQYGVGGAARHGAVGSDSGQLSTRGSGDNA
jgi:hypothetical protein